MAEILASHANASGLMRSMERLARDAKMPVPNVYVIDGFKGLGNLGKLNAAGGKNSVFLTRGILDSFNSANLHGPMDIRLEAIIAHELSHVKGCVFTTLRQHHVPLLLMPLVAVLGYDFYRQAQKHQTDREKHDALEKHANVVMASAVKEHGESIHPMQERIIVSAKYMAAAALGLGAGIMMMRGISNHIEFKADAFSKKLMGSGQPLMDGLKKLRKDTITLLEREGGDLALSFWDKVKIFVYHAHPTQAQRFERLAR